MTDDAKTDTPEEDALFNWARRPKAKRSVLLSQVQQGLRGCHRKKAFNVFGTWYELRTLAPMEEEWTLQFINGNDIYAAAKSRRGPSVAAALTAIGPSLDELQPVEALFEVPEDLPKAQRVLVDGNESIRADWLRSEVLRWLMEPDSHETLIAVLYDKYLELEQERNRALEALDPLSKSAPSGASSSTSSPEKESSSATPASPG